MVETVIIYTPLIYARTYVLAKTYFINVLPGKSVFTQEDISDLARSDTLAIEKYSALLI